LNIEGGDFEVQAVKWGDGIGNWNIQSGYITTLRTVCIEDKVAEG